MTDCPCDNGLIMEEVPGGARQSYRCACPKGEKFARIVLTTGRGKRKKERVISVVPHERPAVEVVPPVARPSPRDLAAGERIEGET